MRLHRRRVPHTLAVAALAAFVAGGCDGGVQQLLEVETPDIITVGVQESTIGAQAWYTAAVGDFAHAFCGDRANNTPLGVCVPSGTVTDELFMARNAATDSWDKRSIDNTQIPQSTWDQLMLAHTRSLRAQHLLIKYPPAAAVLARQLATLKVNEGYTLLLVAEHYCNGVPLWDGLDETNPSTVTLTTADLYRAAIFQFDSALAFIGSTDATIRNMALVGKGRVIVDQATPATLTANLAAAAAVVAPVPTNFVFNAVYSTSSQGMENGLYDWGFNTPNWSVSDKEGVNGLDFVSARDQRVNIDPERVIPGGCQDRTPCPIFNHYNRPESPVAVATGIEARLIEAESQLAFGDAAAWLTTLNLLRTTPQRYGTVSTNGTATKSYPEDLNRPGFADVVRPGLMPLADPGTPATRLNLHFRERAFWLFLTAHRLGDLRRLVRQYGRGAETVFPTGAYKKGGSYGPDVTIPPNATEGNNNPNWKNCTDRNP